MRAGYAGVHCISCTTTMRSWVYWVPCATTMRSCPWDGYISDFTSCHCHFSSNKSAFTIHCCMSKVQNKLWIQHHPSCEKKSWLLLPGLMHVGQLTDLASLIKMWRSLLHFPLGLRSNNLPFNWKISTLGKDNRSEITIPQALLQCTVVWFLIAILVTYTSNNETFLTFPL